MKGLACTLFKCLDNEVTPTFHFSLLCHAQRILNAVETSKKCITF